MISALACRDQRETRKDHQGKHRHARQRYRAGNTAWLIPLVIAFAVSGCSVSDGAVSDGAAPGQGPVQWFNPKTRFVVTQGLEDTVFISPALEAAARQFLGSSRPDRSAAGPTGPDGTPAAQTPGRLLIQPDALSPGSDTPYRLEHSRARSVGLRVDQPLRGNFSATARVMLGRGTTVYTLPEGLGVLDEPTTIRFDTDFVQAEAGLAWNRQISRRVATETEVALGLQETRTKTHVTSALLDVRNTSRHTFPYVALRGGFDLLQGSRDKRAKVHLGAEARLFPGKGLTLRQTLSLLY